MYKFKNNDEVIVKSGRDKGKKGKVEKVIERGNKLIIQGVNIYKRHQKATTNRGAGIFEVTRPLFASKTAIICPKCTKETKVGFKIEGKSKNRICKKCKGVI